MTKIEEEMMTKIEEEMMTKIEEEMMTKIEEEMMTKTRMGIKRKMMRRTRMMIHLSNIDCLSPDHRLSLSLIEVEKHPQLR
jgi:hypothetical protein